MQFSEGSCSVALAVAAKLGNCDGCIVVEQRQGHAARECKGRGDPIVIPRVRVKTDWVVELAVIIGSPAKYLSEADAMGPVAGYAVTNDVSERDFQLERAGQWAKGKSCDKFRQIGPWLVNRDEVLDLQELPMWLTVNGEIVQDGSTKTMVYGVAHLVSYLSQFMTLYPGDVI